MDAFCKSLFVPDKDAEQLAGEQLLSAPAFLDRMLLCLFDALWLKQSEDWSNRGVANMCADEPYETADLSDVLVLGLRQRYPKVGRACQISSCLSTG